MLPPFDHEQEDEHVPELDEMLDDCVEVIDLLDPDPWDRANLVLMFMWRVGEYGPAPLAYRLGMN